jgi:tetratricopeptide (TPR) repeat protein
VVGSKLCAALIGLGRVDEAAEVYLDARLGTTDADTQMQAAYGEAMLHTRHYDWARRDHRRAKGWLQVALTIADLLPDAEKRAVAKTFYANALALVEVHLGRPDEAVRLVSAGRQRLDRQLTPAQWRLHRSVLGHNLARVYSQTGELDAALAEYTRAISLDPNYQEYYLERGNVHRRLGDLDAALRDYTTAIEIGLPCPQASYNRGDLALELGLAELARQDFDRTLVLDDTYVDAWLNRAALRLEAGDLDGAGADIAAGLQRDPDNAHLHCLRGTLATERGDDQGAEQDLQRAIELDPELAGAWANLAVLRWESGDLDGAVHYFDRSLELEDNEDVRANRELALRDRHGG